MPSFFATSRCAENIAPCRRAKTKADELVPTRFADIHQLQKKDLPISSSLQLFYSFLRDFFLGNFFLGWHDRTSFKVSETFITPALHAGC